MNILSNNIKVKRPKKRLGRGIGSGKGKTSGRGVKGQKSRSGVAIKSFEGGQMPLYRRLPKRGFNPINKKKIAKINLDQLQNFVDKKRIDPSNLINLESLKKNNIINKSYLKFKVLGNGKLTSKIDIEVDYSSISAKEKIENLGGVLKIKNPK
ncbi:50S ribosomal protein L15 [Pelagibacterales bacterium SAG-MED16]|jgi:large subunit ribosomal protein L15|nr:50S ribosomal protein L15 [Pelagibacterales bacterium SAG-MED16]|tara:strand:- start:1300 stop:1758 length:459 start_codon:yes stop_codon:yes gene_type:complete